MAYNYEATSFDNSSYYPSHPTADSPASFGIETHIYSSANNPSSTSHDSPRSYPVYDPESPFNSPIVPVKSMGRDGRLKTKLMGIGTEGGYLTSPLILGKSRMNSSSGASNMGQVSTPQISIDSPASTAMTPADSFQSQSNSMGPSSSSRTESSGGVGTGIGISGVNELQEALEMGDYGNANLRIYGMPKQRGRTASECGYLPYPDHMPTTTLGRGKNNVRDVGPSGVPQHFASSPGTKFVEHRFPQSPPPTATPLPPPATGRRPKKNLTVKTLNKAKSCSALSPSAHQQQYGEPLTPVSAHSTGFNIPGVPYNSPIDALAIQQAADPSIMPFSFSDLYNFGLAVDSVEEIDPRKSPYAFANELLGAENGGDGVGIGIGLGMGPNGGYQEEHDFALLHQLPTPYLAHGSGFSSPSTTYLSDPSPDLALMGYQSPASVSMCPGASMESAYSLPPPTTPGRQRCATYGTVPSSGGHLEEAVDPSLLSPQSTQMHHRQLSSTSAYGAGTKFSYPSRYTHLPPQQPHPQFQAPEMSWANSVPPGHQQHHQHHRNLASTGPGDYLGQIDTSLFIPPFNGGGNPGPGLSAAETFERNLEQFEEMYDGHSHASSGYATPGKRGRDDDDEEPVRFDDVDEEYTPRATRQTTNAMHASGGSATGSAHKRLRTVASAPCLPTRRLRPGPKPKSTKSPQEQHQGVFSAILSPPMPQGAFRRASSPYHSDGSALGGNSDDEDDGNRGSLSKEVIQSLYRGIPSHVANGVKVAKRYVCLMEGCDRTFPRKSAIESHIQTHLEDKPFVCPQPDCEASFVRQHDLRRHERIHSGNKPFPCPCGKGFARGDALARHRARGICSGSLVPRRI